MGRFYKTASANPMDYMHRINAPLMERALRYNNQAITDEYTQGQLIGDASSSFNRLTDDEQRANQIAQGYGNQIDQLTKSIAADPANWRNYTEPLRRLKQDLATNYKTGEISKIAANYTTYKTWKDKHDKLVEQWNKFGGKRGGIDPTTMKVYENDYLNKWRQGGAGTAYKNGQYNTLHMEDVMGNMDIQAELSKGFDKVKADLNATETYTNSGMYLIKNGNKTETVSKAKLMELAMSHLQDSTLQSYMRSRQSVGLLHNIFDDKGNMISPISGYGVDPTAIARANKIITDTKVADPKKAAQMQAELDAYIAQETNNPRYNPNSGLAGMIEGAVNSNAWTKSTQTQTIGADPVKLPVWMQGRREYQQGLTRAQTEAHFQIARTDREKAAATTWEHQKELVRLKGEQVKAAAEARAALKAANTPAGKIAASKKLEEATKAVEDKYAEIYINEVPSPDHSFEGDAAIAAKGDTNARSRIFSAIEENMPKVLQAIPKELDETMAQTYLRSLSVNGQSATPESAKEFYNKEKLAGRIPEYKQTINKKGAFGPTLTSSVDPKLTALEKLGEKFNASTNEWYKQHNIETGQIDVNPLTSKAQTDIADIINNSKGGYFSIDQNGNKVPHSGKIARVIGSAGGSSQSKLGYRVISATEKDKDGNPAKFWVFPDDVNEATYSLNRSNILAGLLDQNSAYAVSLKVEDINNINTQLQKGKHVEARTVQDAYGKLVEDPAGLSSIITIGSHQFPAIQHKGTGELTIKDSDGEIIKTFPSVGDFVQYYYRAVKAAEEAAKTKK